MTNMKDERSLKNVIKTRTKTKLNTKVLEVSQKVRVLNCIRILDDSIFVRIQPLNKYPKGEK